MLIYGGADEELSFKVYDIKSGSIMDAENRLTFAEMFIGLMADFKDYQNCTPMCQFVEICIFESPGLFNPEQNRVIKKKLAEFLLNVDSEQKLEVILKGMFIMHKIERYDKNAEVLQKLEKLVKEAKVEETRNWARKLRDDL